MLLGSSALSEFHTSLSKVLTLWHCVKVKQRYLSLEEMANAVEDIFKMQLDDAKINSIIVTAKNMYSQMDQNGDGCLTEEEFVTSCLKDNLLLQNMLFHRHFLDDSNDHYFKNGIKKPLSVQHPTIARVKSEDLG